MSGTIQVGPPENTQLPKKSLGIIFYNEMQKWDADRVAVVHGTTGSKMTFGTFSDLSVQLAVGMKNLGVKKGDVITILSPNSWKYLATTIAGWYLGAKINLLNHDYTTDELGHFFSICRPNFIFCTAQTEPKLTILKKLLCDTKIIFYDNYEVDHCISFNKLLVTKSDGSFRPVELDLQEVAVIVTSSGTTGLPKYVQLTHGGFRVTMVHFGDPVCLDVNQSDTTISYFPFCHLMGFVVALTSLLYGFKNVILEKFVREDFLKLIWEHQVTKLFTVPSVLLYLVKDSGVGQYDISCIKGIICMGAPLSTELKQLAAKQLNMVIRQGYGTTESGMATMTGDCAKKESCVGKVLATNQVKVCHIETGKILAANQIGELRIKSGPVMKGYLGTGSQNGVFDDEGFFKTGDLGYFDAEGFFYIVDRLKDLIKYKGFQVAPTELEGLLSRHPSVKDVAVIGVPDEVAGEVPLAFVVRQPDRDVTEMELVRYVEENISFQKRLRGGVRFIDEIPKTSSGKILRRQLREMYLRSKCKL